MRSQNDSPLTLGMGIRNVAWLLSANLVWVAAAALWLWAPAGPWLLAAGGGFLAACWIHRKELSEWMHEGVHFNFFPHRTWNDRLLNALAGWLFFEELSLHRARHFVHHRDVGYFQSADPETGPLNIQTQSDFWKGVLQDIGGFTALRAIQASQGNYASRKCLKKNQRFRILSFVIHSALITSLLTGFGARGAALVGLHFFSLVSLYPLLNRIRVYSQHLEIAPNGRTLARGSRTSRTLETSVLDRIALHSRVMMYHWEHHHFPTLHYRQLVNICARDKNDPNRYAVGRFATLTRLYMGLPRQKEAPLSPQDSAAA